MRPKRREAPRRVNAGPLVSESARECVPETNRGQAPQGGTPGLQITGRHRDSVDREVLTYPINLVVYSLSSERAVVNRIETPPPLRFPGGESCHGRREEA